jgi:hypothetical protein
VAGRRALLERRLARAHALREPVDLDSQARSAMTQLWSRGRQPSTIVVRGSFIGLSRPLAGQHTDRRPPDPAAGPPLARLLSPRGASLRTALVALFVAQSTRGTPSHLDDLQVDPSDERLGWRDLVLARATHRPDTVRAATPMDNKLRQIKNALDDLASEEVGILALPRAGTPRSRYADIRLRHEGGVRATGAAPEYVPPRNNEWVVPIPVEFFLNGWVHALDDSELAAWLMFRHRYYSQLPAAKTDGVELGGQARLAVYVQKRTVWDQHRNLAIFDLLRHEADDRRRFDGTLDDFRDEGIGRRHRFWVNDDPISKVAVHSVLASVAEALEDPFGLLSA